MSKPQAKHLKGKMSSTRQVNNGQIRKVNMTHRKMAFGDKKRATRLAFWQHLVSVTVIWIYGYPTIRLGVLTGKGSHPLLKIHLYPKQMHINKKIVPLGIRRVSSHLPSIWNGNAAQMWHKNYIRKSSRVVRLSYIHSLLNLLLGISQFSALCLVIESLYQKAL